MYPLRPRARRGRPVRAARRLPPVPPRPSPPRRSSPSRDSDIWRNAASAGPVAGRNVRAYSRLRRRRATAKSIVRHIASGKELKFPRGGASGAGGRRSSRPDGKQRAAAAHADQGRARQGQGRQGESRRTCRRSRSRSWNSRPERSSDKFPQVRRVLSGWRRGRVRDLPQAARQRRGRTGRTRERPNHHGTESGKRRQGWR